MKIPCQLNKFNLRFSPRINSKFNSGFGSRFTPRLYYFSFLKGWRSILLASASLFGTLLIPGMLANAQLQPPAPGDGRALVVRSDIQEANSQTGVVTARGNVQIDYPARQIRATAAQAQYFSNERRIILSGNVFVLQNGNSLRGETITYLIDEGRFVALPRADRQVESTYLVNDPAAPTTPVAPAADTTPFNPKPEFKEPTSE